MQNWAPQIPVREIMRPSELSQSLPLITAQELVILSGRYWHHLTTPVLPILQITTILNQEVLNLQEAAVAVRHHQAVAVAVEAVMHL